MMSLRMFSAAGLVLGFAGCYAPTATPVRTVPAALPMESVVMEPEVVADRFIERAWQANRRNSDLAYMALQRAVSADVQRFARQIVDDEGVVRAELAEAAGRTANATPFVPVSQQDESIKLANLTGSNFDRGFMEAALRDLMLDVSDYERAAVGDRASVARDAAQRLLPLLRKQLCMARETAARVGVVLRNCPRDESALARSLELMRTGS